MRFLEVQPSTFEEGPVDHAVLQGFPDVDVFWWKRPHSRVGDDPERVGLPPPEEPRQGRALMVLFLRGPVHEQGRAGIGRIDVLVAEARVDGRADSFELGLEIEAVVEVGGPEVYVVESRGHAYFSFLLASTMMSMSSSIFLPCLRQMAAPPTTRATAARAQMAMLIPFMMFLSGRPACAGRVVECLILARLVAPVGS